MASVSRSALFASLPPESAVAPRPAESKIVVLDDDPTGTQTVHGIPVLTAWDCAALEAALREPGPCFYVLTNTRAVPVTRACEVNREIGANLAAAAAAARCAYVVISRSDSTLRGHYPAETDALAAGLGVAFDGTLIIPAFFAGGRFTVGDVHYVAENDTLTPAGETEFARDKSFGYRSSDLRAWVEEKTGGRIRATNVVSISIGDLRQAGESRVAQRLLALPPSGVAIVNAVAPSDLAMLTRTLAITEQAGRRYLFRTAADFVAVYAGIAPRPLLTASELRSLDAATGGLLVAGSYVSQTSLQLDALFRLCPQVCPVEIEVEKLLIEDGRLPEIQRCLAAVDRHLAAGRSAALFTSRRLRAGRGAVESLAIGKIVSESLVRVVEALATRPRWLIAKGGITSSDLATRALGIRRALIAGQALPGVPVWRTGSESKWPGLAYVVFPGNVGGPDALARLVAALLA